MCICGTYTVNVIPKNYELVFEPDLKKFVFVGRERIKIECKRPTDTIIMNSAEIEIIACGIRADKDIACIAKTKPEKEELHIKMQEKISGTAEISIEFRGTLNDRLLGFYRSQYKQGSHVKYLATTQFEAADARRAFPCWDEPQAKATFDISILADSKFDAISNMPVHHKKKIGAKTLYKFERTPVMSTYLVYLGVGQFEYLRGRTGNTTIRVITTKGNKSKGVFALELAKKLLGAYEKYFGIKYPLPKLDLIAIPDFAAGAMENWGAITFRETILLYDPKTSSTATKQFIAEVISHEIAHQWFGNLVTMKWWNDLWLNESFATFMATKFVDMFYPEWDMWSQFVQGEMNTAMGLDALKSTHPIDVKVNSPAEIREIFDAISYDKGGCILRMLEHFVGEADFQKGLKRYLVDFQYKNATGDDLWNAIGKASNMPVRSMIKSWLVRPGFPLVNITQNGNRLDIRQDRYLMERGGEKGSLWHIPIAVKTAKTRKKLLTGESITLRLEKNTMGIVANQGRHGFYRTRYDKSMLVDLKMLVDQKRIAAIDRWAIQNDLFSLCLSGRENIRNYLDFSDAYYNDDNYMVSIDVASNLASLYFRTINEEFSNEILAYSSDYLRHLLLRLGWDPKADGKHTDALLRSHVILMLGRMNDIRVTKEAAKQYKKILMSSKSIRPDIVEPVCSIAAWNGDAAVHSHLANMYDTADTVEEKLRFLGAMCGFKNKNLLKKTLDFSLTSSVRSQNMQLPIIKVSMNPHGRKILWPWLVKNWKKINGKVGHGNPLFNRIVASISRVADSEMTDEIKQFFKDNPAPGTERTQTQVLERIRINSAFLKFARREFRHG